MRTNASAKMCTFVVTVGPWVVRGSICTRYKYFREPYIVHPYANSVSAGSVFWLLLSCQPSDVLDLKTPYMGMKPRKVTLAGSALTVCKLTKDGRETKSCEVRVQLRRIPSFIFQFERRR